MNTSNVLKHINLLFVDDDIEVASEAYSFFVSKFKSVSLAHSKQAAIDILQKGDIDLVVTDIKMPGDDGLNLIEAIRATDEMLPIIILTAFTDTDYLLRAANLRIDGYITKPISAKKLMPALDKITPRLELKIKTIDLSQHVSYDLMSETLMVDAKQVSLGKKERILLNLFIKNSGRIVTRKEIQSAVWASQVMSDSALKNLLLQLRKKLKYNFIENVPMKGWFFKIDNDQH